MLYSVCHAANVHLHYLRQINVQEKGIILEKRKMRYVVYALKKGKYIFMFNERTNENANELNIMYQTIFNKQGWTFCKNFGRLSSC